MVQNIRTVSTSLEVTTYGGPMTCNQKCDIPGWDEAWFNKESVTNIISMAESANKFNITYNNTKMICFIYILKIK